MQRPWIAEETVGLELARVLIEEQFPALAPLRIAPLGSGWDNDAFLVESSGTRRVFRFPRREPAVAWLESETALLPALAPHLPLQIPDPVHVGRPARGYPWPWAGYAFLPGRTACRARLDADERARAAEPLARFLRALHDFPAELARRHGADSDRLDRLGRPRRTRMLIERLETAREHGLVEDLEPWSSILAGVPEEDGGEGGAPDGVGKDGAPAERLVHSDLYARHLLVDADRRLAGVIDWGDVHLGDVAIDLGLVHGFLPARARERFLGVYGDVDGRTWRLARWRALYSAAMVLVYGYDVGDRALVDEGLASLRLLRDD